MSCPESARRDLGHWRRVSSTPPESQFEAAAHGVALDGSDCWLGEAHVRRAHGRHLSVGVGQRLEIGARRERAAGSRQHCDSCIAIGVEGFEDLDELDSRGGVDRVSPFESVDGHDQDAISMFGVDSHGNSYDDRSRCYDDRSTAASRRGGSL